MGGSCHRSIGRAIAIIYKASCLSRNLWQSAEAACYIQIGYLGFGQDQSLYQTFKRPGETTKELAVVLNLKGKGSNPQAFFEAALELTREKRESLVRKGLLPRPMRAMVVGIPNVGKSSLINWFVGSKKARTGDMPGVTRGNQWIKVHPELELLDTPGILPPTLFSGETMTRLALLNLVPQDSYDTLDIANLGATIMQSKYPKRLESYLEGLSTCDSPMYYMAEKKKFLANHGRIDDLRAANIFLREIGRAHV